MGLTKPPRASVRRNTSFYKEGGPGGAPGVDPERLSHRPCRPAATTLPAAPSLPGRGSCQAGLSRGPRQQPPHGISAARRSLARQGGRRHPRLLPPRALTDLRRRRAQAARTLQGYGCDGLGLEPPSEGLRGRSLLGPPRGFPPRPPRGVCPRSSGCRPRPAGTVPLAGPTGS